jgi:hypothetical protein
VICRTQKDKRFIDQIVQEHQVGSKLDHPNIRAITKYLKNQKYMFGPVLDAALLMELVDATTLDLSPRPSGVNIAKYFAQGDHSNEIIIDGRSSSVIHARKLSLQLHAYGEGRLLLLSRDITAHRMQNGTRA